MLSKSDREQVLLARKRNRARLYGGVLPEPGRGIGLRDCEARTLALFDKVEIQRPVWPLYWRHGRLSRLCPQASLGEVLWCYEPVWWFGRDMQNAVYFYSEQWGRNKKNLPKCPAKEMPAKARRFWMVCVSLERLEKSRGWLIGLQRLEKGAKSAALAAYQISRGAQFRD